MHPKPQEFGISLTMSSEKKTYEIIIVIKKKRWE
jgi:hypothetical protein